MKNKMLNTLSVLFVLVTASVAGAKEGTKLEGVINVNTASATELMILPGVGEVKAQTIIDARTQKQLASKDDLLAVKGIGEKMIEVWSPYLAFSGATTLKEIPVTASAEAALAGATSATKVSAKTVP